MYKFQYVIKYDMYDFCVQFGGTGVISSSDMVIHVSLLYNLIVVQHTMLESTFVALSTQAVRKICVYISTNSMPKIF